MEILTQFLYRMSFGLAAAMAATSPAMVTSGYFRVHLHVVLGLNVLAAMVAVSNPSRFAWWPAVAAGVLSYVGSVLWLYESKRAGRIVLALIALVCLVGAWVALPTMPTAHDSPLAIALWLFDPVTGGLLLGVTMAAMLLGHWYLNNPGMQLAPLRRLLLILAGAIVARGVASAFGLGGEWHLAGVPPSDRLMFISLRWLAGVVGTLTTTIMAWETLKVPNTQSATGILYVGVITSFLGELTAQLLSAETQFPL